MKRPTHWKSAPVHLTMRGKRLLPNFRAQSVVAQLTNAMRQASKNGFRLLHFSIQPDHIHMIAEADDGAVLRGGAQGLAIRLAKAINRASGRKGKVWEVRHERHDLRTLREVRNCLVYVLFNHRKHARGTPGEAWANVSLDPKSSAIWFDGFNARAGPALAKLSRELALDPEKPCVVAPTVWPMTTGWRTHGLLDLAESPKIRPRR